MIPTAGINPTPRKVNDKIIRKIFTSPYKRKMFFDVEEVSTV
jgi:hypothetical protein